MEESRSKARWGVLFASLRGVSDAGSAFNVIGQVDRKVSFRSTPSKNLAEKLAESDGSEEEEEMEAGGIGFQTPSKVKAEATAFSQAYAGLSVEAKVKTVADAWPEARREAEKLRSGLMMVNEVALDAHVKINDVHAELGSAAAEAGACTVWGAIAKLEADKAPPNLEAQFEVLLARSDTMRFLKERLAEAEAALRQVEEKNRVLAESYAALHDYAAGTLPRAFGTFVADVNVRIEQVEGSNGINGRGPAEGQGGGEKGGVREALARLDEQEGELKKLRGRVEGESLQIGSQTFRSKVEMKSWVALRIPDGDVCFLLDVVSLLELMGIEKGSFAANLEVANQVGKTRYRSPTEAAVMESFSVEVPAVLVDGSRAATGGKGTFESKALKLLRSFAEWSLQDEANGVFYRIQDFIDRFEERQGLALEVRFGGDEGSPALALMRGLATASVDFVRRLCNWVNTFYLEASQTSTTADEAWKLTTDILLGVFRELKKVRQLGSSVSTAWLDDRVGGCSQLLWATLRAHKLMKEFTSYNFSGHPRLAPYVLRHLTRNAATKGMVKEISDKLGKEVAEAKAQAKSAQAAADRHKK